MIRRIEDARAAIARRDGSHAGRTGAAAEAMLDGRPSRPRCWRWPPSACTCASATVAGCSRSRRRL